MRGDNNLAGHLYVSRLSLTLLLSIYHVILHIHIVGLGLVEHQEEEWLAKNKLFNFCLLQLNLPDDVLGAL